MAGIAYGLESGSRVGGYTIERVIGRGGMGVVFAATHTRLERTVALKVLSPELALDDEFRTRFIRESRLAASIEHPGVIPIYDAGEDGEIAYLAMRYVEGPDLEHVLRAEGPLSLARTLELVGPVAAALDAAHSRGLVHRDVKPANVLVERETGHVYLTDFGLAKVAGATGLTGSKRFLGTVHYASPEQIEARSVDERADIYALGCVTYHCLTGQPPFPLESEMAIAQAHLYSPTPAVSTLRPDLPPRLDGVIATAMAKHPEVRYRTAGELIGALKGEPGVTKYEPVLPETAAVVLPRVQTPTAVDAAVARGSTPPTVAAARKSSRGRLIAIAVVVLALVAAAVVAALALSGGSTPPPPPPPPKPTSVGTLVHERLALLAPLQKELEARIEAAERTPASLRSMQAAARDVMNAVLQAQGWSSATLAPRTSTEESVTKLFNTALAAHVAYARAVETIPTDPPSFAPRYAASAITLAGRAEEAYARLEGAAGGQAMPLRRSDHLRLETLVVHPPPPPPPPPPPAPPGPNAGATSDTVDYSGGEGVRYRYSPYLHDLVPGNGPFEGDTVTIYCYTTGETVRGNPYWAKIGVNPDRYAPATYLHSGHDGRPAGAATCGSSPPPPPPPSVSGTPGVDYDYVDYSGGVGARYRYSPFLSDLVPGNGPFEGDRVTVYCYTTGESVKGNPYWAKIALNPDRYVPATYLRFGHSGAPAGVSSC